MITVERPRHRISAVNVSFTVDQRARQQDLLSIRALVQRPLKSAVVP